MLGFLKKLLLGGDGASQSQAADAVLIGDYRVLPTPRKEPSGWRVEGIIEKDFDGAARQHKFVRADIYMGFEDTVSVVVTKARRIIEEKGDKMFDE